MAVRVVSVSSAISRTSRPGRSTKQNATLQPSRPNSRAIARPSPVAPPVTTAVLPRYPSGMMLTGCGAVAAPERWASGPKDGWPENWVAMGSRRYGPFGDLARRSPVPYIALMRTLIWVAVALVGATAWGVLALHQGETINAAWLVLAAVGTYLVAYRYYSLFLARKVFGLAPRRATPAERLNNGRYFVPTTRWVLFGHHFAAIAGAGPLVGPVLAAQFGYLPGVLWIVFGVVLGGAVQDFIILFSSMRRDGKSLGQMAKEEIGETTGL